MGTGALEHVYHTPQSKRIQMTAINFAGLVLISFLMGLMFGYSLSLLACVGIAIVMYFSSGQTITVSTDRLIQKIPLGKARVFLFSNGEFSLHEVTGVKAWFMYLKSQGTALCYTPKATGKTISLALLLSEEDIRKIHQQIQEYLRKPLT